MIRLPTINARDSAFTRSLKTAILEMHALIVRQRVRGDGSTFSVTGSKGGLTGHCTRHDTAIAKVTDSSAVDAKEQTWDGSAWVDGAREWDSDTGLGTLADSLGHEPALNDLVVVVRGAGGKWTIAGVASAGGYGVADVGGKTVTTGTVASSTITFPDGSTTTSTIDLQGLASGQTFTFPSGINIYVFTWDGGYGGLWPYSMTGFDGSAGTTQVYGHIDGKFQWLNTCPP